MTSPKNKFVGFHIDDDLAIRIRLYAVSKNIPLSQVARTAVKKWMDENGMDEENLIARIIGRMRADYILEDLKKEADPSINFDKTIFVERWRVLLTRKITPEVAAKIIQRYEKDHK